MKLKSIGIGIVLLAGFTACDNETATTETAQSVVSNTSVERVEPPHWWVGFENPMLQLLVKHEDIGAATPSVNYAGLSLRDHHTGASPNYLFLDLELSDVVQPGKFDISFSFENGDVLTHTYELKARAKAAEDWEGFDSSDAIFLITPDRFANANPENDIVTDLRETHIDRTDDYARHGGDIQGITDHLDYIQDLGFTAVWPSPLLINDMERQSYHGYAITDYYRVDPRFGTLDDYITLSRTMAERGMKLIMDQVANHCGSGHWWMEDLPFDDWLNYQDIYASGEQIVYSNHRRTTNQDTYASEFDRKQMADGWFVASMPDLNQRNPFMARYIIQNSIWWIETLELGGIRQDTYPYPDKDFMSNWAGAIMTEYPNFSIVGEEWSYNPLLIAYWQEGNANKDGYDSNLKSSMDFAMQANIRDGLNEPEAWNTGLVKIYEGLANDFVYPNPSDIMVFPDNHDMDRVFTQMNNDITLTRMNLVTMAMLPRTPQFYYGTEILMENSDKPGDHGLIRTDFPGGWAGDTVNAFSGIGLSKEQKDMQAFVRKLLNFRKQSEALKTGGTKHFAPRNGVYVLVRFHGEEMVVLILNKNESTFEVDLSPYTELGLTGKSLRNVFTGDTVVWDSLLSLPAKGAYLFTTQ